MRTVPNDKILAGVIPSVAAAIAVAAALTSLFCAGPARAMARGGHHSFLGGPWELVVTMGMEGQPLRFPLTVADENKIHEFENVLPVMGTPIKIRIEQYLPNLGWETAAVKHPGGGTIAKLTVEGKDLEQDLWLSSANPSRQSMSSRVGSIAIIELKNAKTAEKLVRDLTDRKAVGILTVWPDGGNSPLEFAARLGRTVSVPGFGYKLKVAEYVPHYSIDLETRKVVSVSDKPVNPAVKITGDDGTTILEQWVWAKFRSSPHENAKIPLRMKFAECDLGGTPGKRILIVAPGAKRWLLYSRRGKRRFEKAILDKSYPLADAGFSFRIENIVDGAIVKTDWKNQSEALLRPAIVVRIEQDGAGRQTVLELNRPYHRKTEFGTLVLLYRRNPAPAVSKD
ncbi:MAG: hypothetical protein ACYS0H_05435 [Planctomycetota bacterium]